MKMRTVVVATALALVSAGCVWNFETLDGQQNGPNGRVNAQVGEHTSAIVYNGRPHVFYHDFTNDDLRHGYWNGQFWAFETLDGAGGSHGRINAQVGSHNSVVLYNGRPHVFYWHSGDGDLRHAYYNGQFWAFETLDGAGGPHGRIDAPVGTHSSAILYNGRPHVFYGEYSSNSALRHGYWNGQFWAFETLDGTGGPNGRINADVAETNSVTLYNGRPHIFYKNDTGDDLRHGYWNGQFWAFETLDGTGGPNGRVAGDVGAFSDVVVYRNRPHVIYLDVSNSDLRHAAYNGSTWLFETVDGSGGPGGRINAPIALQTSALVHNDRLRAFYHDHSDGDLRHAYFNGSVWGFETLDGHQAGPTGSIHAALGRYSTAILYNGRPDVFYSEATGGNLRHAWFG